MAEIDNTSVDYCPYYAQFDYEKRTMKHSVVIAAIGVALGGWFIVSPFVGLDHLKSAVDSRNPASLEDRIDFKRLRMSLAGQIVSAYLKLTGRTPQLGLFGTAIAVNAGASLADPLLAEIVNPEAMLNFFSGAKSSAIPLGAPAPNGVLNFPNAGMAWNVLSNIEYGFGNFYISVPLEAAPADQFRLRLQVLQWRWKLTGIYLPQRIRAQLAQELQRKIGS
jgi:hypothetical protein